MDRSEADRLRVGDRVRFRSPRADSMGNTSIGGTVTRVDQGYRVFVEWDDGQEGAVHPTDMAMYEREVRP